MGSDADARRRAEAIAITDEEQNEQARIPPIPCGGLMAGVEMLRDRDDGCSGIRQLRAVARSEEWSRLDDVERAVLVSWANRRAPVDWKPAVQCTLGTVDRNGRYRPAPVVQEEPDINAPDSLADLPDVENARAVAHDVFYAGKVTLIHGPSGGGKSTLLALASAAITTGGMFAGRPTVEGDIIICVEDAETYRTVVHGAGGNLSRVKLRTWAELPDAVRTLKPVAVTVDTLQFVAHHNGSGELDSAIEVDRILRPLEALARETGAAVTVLDHEPWSDGKNGDRETGTKGRPRHSGAKVATVDAVMRCTAAKSDDNRIESISIGPSKVKGARRGIDVTHETIALDGMPTGPAHSDPDGDRWLQFRSREGAVREYLQAHPGASKRQIMRAVGLPGGGRRQQDFGAFVESLGGVFPCSAPTPPEQPEHDVVPRVPPNGNRLFPCSVPIAEQCSGNTEADHESGSSEVVKMDVKARKIGPAGFADRKRWTHILETAREHDPEAFALADGVEACDADEKEARSTMRAMGWSDERIEQTITSATPDEPLLLPWPEDFDPGPGELVRQEFDPPLPASQRRISGAA